MDHVLVDIPVMQEESLEDRSPEGNQRVDPWHALLLFVIQELRPVLYVLANLLPVERSSMVEIARDDYSIPAIRSTEFSIIHLSTDVLSQVMPPRSLFPNLARYSK